MASCSIPANKAKHESTTTNPNWLELPKDITSNILQKLCPVEILISARNVCPYWWNICKDPLMWRTIRMTDIHMLRYNSSNLSNICRYAVDKSCGGLEHIYIKFFGNDDLLQYVADRASKLRRLGIEECHRLLSNKGLIKAVKKFPLLEELHISKCHLLDKVSFDIIGQCCPLLKSLSLFGYFKCDRQAFEIAEWMPRLRHLKILNNNNLTNDGLFALLNGCTLLESLDLRGCFYLELTESIKQRCNMQINDFLLPLDSMDEDYYTFSDPDLLLTRLRWRSNIEN
ncbi:unnamed protein product [Vicia faba]|uniref:F-box domain-containing protein n=1 Tax=Vicia faba TaxID=3906 RepID=A0AAV0ZI29_VICFA|nr:unnamed protein product [Vicia faba]